MSLTKVSFSMITGAPINPLDFGATGTGTGDDTAGLQAAIDACPAGGLVYGNGLTYRTTGVTIGDSITVEGVNLLLFEKSPAQTSQDAFTIEADGVKLLNCGATITEAALPGTTNSAGVYSVGYDNVVIDGGEWDGSINKDYTPGNYRGPILITGTDCTVMNTITRNAYGEGLWMLNCSRPTCINNKAYNAGGSMIVVGTTDTGLVDGNLCYNDLTGQGNSAMAVGGNLVITNNTVIGGSGNGISFGEGGGVPGGLIANNIVYNYDTQGVGGFAGILTQGAQNVVVENNYIGPCADVAQQNYGIYMANAPLNYVVRNNTIEQAYTGIQVNDGLGLCSGEIIGNTIKNSYGWSIYVGNHAKINIDSNTMANNFVTGTWDTHIYMYFPTASVSMIRIVGNVASSNTIQYDEIVYLESPLTSSTQYIQQNNVFTNWSVQPFSDTRSCTYDVSGDNYQFGSAKSALVTLTNGGTTTTVTTPQVTSVSKITLALGNAAAATLNPVYRVSAQTNGSFTITHTAGTAAAEQLRWTII